MPSQTGTATSLAIHFLHLLYQEKMLGQELSILAKLWAIAGSAQAEDIQGPLAHDLAVVDIGAGNGCLALLAALVLGGFAVLVPPAVG